LGGRSGVIKEWYPNVDYTDLIIQATVGVYGDLQGITGKIIQEIDGLKFQGMLDFRAEE
jgi:hypothetical protein